MTDEEIEKETEEWYVILNMNCKYEICRRCPKSRLFKGSLKECDNWIKQKHKDEMKDKISFALKDPILQQGFKIICKENAELKEKVSYLEDNLRVARKDRENLQLKVGKGLKEFAKDCPYSALKFYANGYYAEQLAKAKEILRKFLDAKSIEETYVAESEADKFLMEIEND